MSDNSIISVGDTYRLYGSEVKTHSDLPVGTYEIQFNPMAGYSLEKVDDLTAVGERVYGNRQVKADKIIRSYKHMDRNLGVMLSGDKGQGKSLFVRMLADAARADDMPVIKVTKATPGIADFIDSLGECLVIFDEFEKVFRKSSSYDDEDNSSNSQDQFLSVFDGTSSVNRIYCITFNNMYGVSNYMLNRPGRFHYHLRFDYPTVDEIETYLIENVEGITTQQIKDVVRFSLRTSINYDHLRAISFEFKTHENGTRLGDFIDDLNIYISIDKKELPAELRYDTETKIQAAQIPDDAKFKYFMISWD